MKASAKRVLIVAHDFPPYRTSGVYRMTGLTKYLLPLGWTPSVLAAETRGGTTDPSLLRRVPSEMEVVRAAAPRLAFWEEPTARALKSVGALAPRNNGHREAKGDAWLRKAGEFLRSCVYFPDEAVSWVPFAFAKAIRLHRQRPFEVIYSSGPPRSSALIGFLLRTMLRIPWVLEFRDPWYASPRPLRRRFEARLHNLLLKRADAVVVVTEGHARDLQAAWGVPPEKLAVIRNGFDEDDFRDEPEPESEVLPAEYFHLSHFGTIYEGNSGSFFPALKELAAERPDLTHHLRVNVIGFPDEAVARHVNDPQLKPLVQMRGFVPHEEALQIMRATDCLLLFWADPNFSRMAVAGKTYEYLRIGRPILAVTSNGEMQQLIEEGKAGWVARPDDTAGIKRILQSLLCGFQAEGRRPRTMQPEFASQFRYDNLANKLARVFDKVTNHAS
jgi:glycosyltransferase involved in cell wall biosynthesis